MGHLIYIKYSKEDLPTLEIFQNISKSSKGRLTDQIVQPMH